MPHQEIATIEISVESLKTIMDLGIRYNLKTVDVPDFDYTQDDIWQRLKSESSKAYRELKKREFELRNKITKT